MTGLQRGGETTVQSGQGTGLPGGAHGEPVGAGSYETTGERSRSQAAGQTNGWRLHQLTVGQRATFTRRVTEREVMLYMGVTGDTNPIYLDRNYAARTPVEEPVAPAVLLAGYVFTALMQRLPGPGTLSLMQTFHFLHPVRIGDTITIVVEVIAIDEARGRVRLRAVGRNQHRQEVLSGEAEVVPPSSLRPVLTEAFEDYD